MDVVLTIHSINRWAIVVVAAVAVIRFAIGWLGKQDYRPMDRGLMSALWGCWTSKCCWASSYSSAS